MRRSILAGAALVALAIALALRAPQLALRPLHHDESINAAKFAELFETSRYVYDPQEYHGPLPYYLTLLPAWLSGAGSFADVSEWTLRSVPALFGCLLVLLVLLLSRGLGQRATAAAMLFLAVSPIFAYYSRDYIHEIYCVCFCALAILAGWRYYLTRRAGWFFLAGISLALMQTTKETSVIAAAMMGLATLITMAWDRYRPVPLPKAAAGRGLPVWVLIGTMTTALFISMTFYSSFYRNPRGMLDSLSALLFYFQRTGQTSLHDHPWYYYLQLLSYTHNLGAPVWSEGLLLILAAVGMGATFARKEGDENTPLVRFLAVYSLGTLAVYSGLRYKTPWLALNFHFGLILLAGVGTAWLLSRVHRRRMQVVAIGLLLLGTAHLAWQSWQLNFKYYANRRHPYVYAQTVDDCLNLVRFVERAASQSADGQHTRMAVISPDYWPLPYYLRAYDQVGYWSSPPADSIPAPIYVTSFIFASKLESRLGDGYHQEYFGLRPDVPLAVFVRTDLWEAMRKAAP